MAAVKRTISGVQGIVDSVFGLLLRRQQNLATRGAVSETGLLSSMCDTTSGGEGCRLRGGDGPDGNVSGWQCR